MVAGLFLVAVWGGFVWFLDFKVGGLVGFGDAERLIVGDFEGRLFRRAQRWRWASR